MTGRQHVWVGPEATTFEAVCEECQAIHRKGWEERHDWSLSVDLMLIAGTLRREADVGFTTCGRGHRVVVRRVGRALSPIMH